MRLFYPVVDCTRIFDAITGIVEIANAGDKVFRHAIVDSFCELLRGWQRIEIGLRRFAPLPSVEISVAAVRSVHHRDCVGGLLETMGEGYRNGSFVVLRFDLYRYLFPVEDADLAWHDFGFETSVGNRILSAAR